MSIYIGRRDQLPEGMHALLMPISGLDRMQFLKPPGQVPFCFPQVPEGYALICGLDTLTDGEQLFACKTLEDMLECDGKYGNGIAMGIHWYFGDVVVITTIEKGE